jgi:serine protease Do
MQPDPLTRFNSSAYLHSSVHAQLSVRRGAALSPGMVLMLFLAAMFATLISMPSAALAQRALQQGPQSVAELAARLQDAVVNISTSQSLEDSPGVPAPKVPEGSPFEEYFNDFSDRGTSPRRVSSLGSGFVIDPSGLIVTNNHVIENADEIIINFTDGSKLKVVEIVGRDTKTDLALLRVEAAKPLPHVVFGDSSAMQVGDWVMAIGNPFGLGGSVTLGIVSATRRDINAGPYDDFIQTDAAINRGNSGGPLFSMAGEVIGVNTAIISPTGGSIGIGFALPSNTAARVIDQLRRFGETRRGWIGVRIQSVTEEIAASIGLETPSGAIIANITPGGPAATAGLKVGDIVMSYDGQTIKGVRELPRLVAQSEIGAEIELEVLRQDERIALKVVIERLDEGEEAESAVLNLPTKEGAADQKLVLGLSLAPLSDALRSEYGIAASVKGVVVTEVAPQSDAQLRSIKPGDVIVEITHQPVSTPEEVIERVAGLRALKRPSALLLLSDNKGDMNFVALPLDKG